MYNVSKALLTIMEDGCELSQLLAASLDENAFTVASRRQTHDSSCCSSRLLVIDDAPIPAPHHPVVQLCRSIRSCPGCAQLPVIVVSSSNGEQDAVLALAAGADDFVRRPFYTAELLARISALLRRCSAPLPALNETYICGPLCLDSARHTLLCDGRCVELTATEFRILRHLMANPGLVFPRETLLEVGIGEDSYACSRTLDTHMASIRRKLSTHRNLIRTIWGVGYRLEVPAEATAALQAQVPAGLEASDSRQAEEPKASMQAGA